MGTYERLDQDWYGLVHVGLLHHKDQLKPVATHIYILIYLIYGTLRAIFK